MASSSGTSNTQSATQPWTPTINPLMNSINSLGTAYGQAQANAGNAPSNFLAAFTPSQYATFNQMIGQGTNQANTSANGLNALGGSYSGLGTNALGSAVSGLNSYNPASTNNINTAINGANQYAAGINIPGQVQQAMQSAEQTANQVTLPQMATAAARSGNINSSGLGNNVGIVQESLANQAGNLAASLENSAYSTGAGLAQNAATSNNSNILSALLGQGSLGTQAGNLGASAYSAAPGALSTSLGLAAQGGLGQQEGAQNVLSNQLQQYNFGQSSPFTAINNYLSPLESIAGLGQEGQSSTQTTQTPSLLNQLGAYLGVGSSLFGNGGSNGGLVGGLGSLGLF